jgi:hypothetical protein
MTRINLGWYSVTPEELAKYIALAITNKNSVVVDAFCGSGGNAIQVLFTFTFIFKFTTISFQNFVNLFMRLILIHIK